LPGIKSKDKIGQHQVNPGIHNDTIVNSGENTAELFHAVIFSVAITDFSTVIKSVSTLVFAAFTNAERT